MKMIKNAKIVLTVAMMTSLSSFAYAQSMQIGLRNVNNNYISVSQDKILYANSPFLGDNQKFTIIDSNEGTLLGDDTVYLRAQSGLYVGAALNWFGYLVAGSPWTQEWETFQVKKLPDSRSQGSRIRPGDKIGFRDVTGGFVCSVINMTGAPLIAGSPWLYEWESFTLAIPKPQRPTSKGFMLFTKTLDWSRVFNDIKFLANQGADLVRFPIYFPYVPSVNWWIEYASQASRECEKYGMTLVIDIHQPGNHESSEISDVTDFVKKWQRIASFFKGRGGIWYDLLNEPKSFVKPGVSWESVALKAANEIRKVDKITPIVYSSPGTTTENAKNIRKLPGITKQILQFHFYDWRDLQMSDFAPNWARYGVVNAKYKRSDLRKRLEAVRDAGVRNNVPVYIGEVAIQQKDPNQSNGNGPLNESHPDTSAFMYDFTNLCDGFGINLTIHAFNEDKTWDYQDEPVWDIIWPWLGR